MIVFTKAPPTVERITIGGGKKSEALTQVHNFACSMVTSKMISLSFPSR